MPETSSRWAGYGTRVADAQNRRLVDILANGNRLQRALSPSRIAAFALATPVHLVSVGILALAGWLLVGAEGFLAKILAVLCVLLVAFGLRRGAGRVRKGPGLLDADRFPATRALVQQVADLIGSPMPARLEISSEFNAYVTTGGWRGRRLMSVGAPLWVALAPQARVALLAHELGHFAHGDILRGRYVGGAAYSRRGVQPGGMAAGVRLRWRRSDRRLADPCRTRRLRASPRGGGESLPPSAGAPR